MNWWDQGYYLIQRARRVPVSNPTQERAPNAARFYTETDETRALERADARAFAIRAGRLGVAVPSRAGRLDRGTVSNARRLGRPSRIATTTRSPTGGRTQGWTPVWLFYEPYYRSMAYRLAVLGGRAAIPVDATTVVTLVRPYRRARLSFSRSRERAAFSYLRGRAGGGDGEPIAGDGAGWPRSMAGRVSAAGALDADRGAPGADGGAEAERRRRGCGYSRCDRCDGCDGCDRCGATGARAVHGCDRCRGHVRPSTVDCRPLTDSR